MSSSSLESNLLAFIGRDLKHNSSAQSYFFRQYTSLSNTSIIKAICNAAYNIHYNTGIARSLSSQDKALFASHRKAFDRLVSLRVSHGQKRKLLISGACYPFLSRVIH